jgi:hypothetical protein
MIYEFISIAQIYLMLLVAKPVAKPNYTATSDGCGSYSFNLDFAKFNMGELNDCCDTHDYCYDSCNEPKAPCDDAFDSCLKSKCEKWKHEQPGWNLNKEQCWSFLKHTILGEVGTSVFTFKAVETTLFY